LSRTTELLTPGHVVVTTYADTDQSSPITMRYDEITVSAPGGPCTEYTYEISSHYRSIVLDDRPVAYWPLGESSGTTAANVAAVTEDQLVGTYSSVTYGAS